LKIEKPRNGSSFVDTAQLTLREKKKKKKRPSEMIEYLEGKTKIIVALLTKCILMYSATISRSLQASRRIIGTTLLPLAIVHD